MNRDLKIIVIVFLSIIAILLMGNIIVIGDKLGQITHVYIEYCFYIVLILLFCIYILLPIYRVHTAPEFPKLSLDGKNNSKQLLAFAKSLSANYSYIKDEETRKRQQKKFRKKISGHSADISELKILISEEIEQRVNGNKELGVLGINERIKEWAINVFTITAISQNSKIDTLSVLIMNYKMIADIIAASGFRPTKPQLFKMYVKVLTTSLFTYCTSQVLTEVVDHDLCDITNGSTSADTIADSLEVNEINWVDKILSSPIVLGIPKVIVGSTIQGCTNALMTLRIGYVTKAYLMDGVFALNSIKNKRKIKNQAMKSALKTMPAVLAASSVVVGGTVYSLLKQVFK